MATKNVAPQNIQETQLCSDEAKLRSEFAKRRLDNIFTSVNVNDVVGLLDQGWVPFKEGKTRTRLQQPKDIEHQLKDDLWSLFHRMGYRTLNVEDFEVLYVNADGSSGRRTLAVVAEDEETVVVVECKVRQDRGRKSFAKDIVESAIARRALQKQFQVRHRDRPKHKILWLYATRNVIWSESDIEGAAAAGIRVITENEFKYFERIDGFE